MATAAPVWANPDASNSTQPVAQQQGTITNEDANNILLAPYSTLDEPVIETIMRDVRAVGTKLKVVMLPLDRNGAFGYTGLSSQESEPTENLGENQKKVLDQLKDWDLWGPLIVCLTLSVILSFKAPTNQAALVFASVFLLVSVGSAAVTMNAQLLGGTISFFQSVCVLGYCVFPMTVSALTIGILRLTPVSFVWLDILFLALGFLWATRASSVFIASYIQKERRLLAVFPVFFFYIFLGW
eukprot:CAMPEP_0119012790 /NCGR_PEP_ID=MMETSP1176-20130426/7596_1 /TAXON_ID=265551 /ORGANISM="Synedropsis recta cf, Strain CCMP1620" /LENGTH=240 /DNA_ID=CAMNT_0006965817 /DNA_START=58 /DNA_END=777 /DNA_ORIENTATION=+